MSGRNLQHPKGQVQIPDFCCPARDYEDMPKRSDGAIYVRLGGRDFEGVRALLVELLQALLKKFYCLLVRQHYCQR